MGVAGTLEVKSIVREVLEQQQQQVRLPAKGFSQANLSDADDVIETLQLTEVNGNETQPIVVPDDAADNLAFNHAAYPNEDAAVGAFMQHHQLQLQQHGVCFGRGSFQMYDIHTQKSPWTIRASKTQLSGTADCCVAAHGLSYRSAANRAGVIYTHKQSEQQKEAYRHANPDVAQVRYLDHRLAFTHSCIDVCLHQICLAREGLYSLKSAMEDRWALELMFNPVHLSSQDCMCTNGSLLCPSGPALGCCTAWACGISDAQRSVCHLMCGRLCVQSSSTAAGSDRWRRPPPVANP